MINRMICGNIVRLDGFKGYQQFVDMNYCYADFPAIIKHAGKNNFDIDTAVEQYKLGDTVRFSYVF